MSVVSVTLRGGSVTGGTMRKRLARLRTLWRRTARTGSELDLRSAGADIILEPGPHHAALTRYEQATTADQRRKRAHAYLLKVLDGVAQLSTETGEQHLADVHDEVSDYLAEQDLLAVSRLEQALH